jgi:hypothetical protein
MKNLKGMALVEYTITHLQSGGLITNYFCTSRCRHCLYNAGPHWPKKYIDPETTEMNLRVVRELGCSAVHIGGGEPMLRPDELAKVLQAAKRVGVSVDYVETNSSWFKDPEAAKRTLVDLRQQGLRTLLVSISPFHNEYIPFSRVTGVIEAARQAGVGIFPWIPEFISDLSEFDPQKSHPPQAYQQRFGQDYYLQVLRRYWVHLGGRALNTFRPHFKIKTYEQILSETEDGCHMELSDTSHFHMDLFGNYIPGLCAGLSIWRDDLGKPLAEEKYPILTTLYRSGIRALADMAQHQFGYRPQKNGYINKCDVCTEIRTFLVGQNYRKSPELKPEQFYHSKTIQI